MKSGLGYGTHRPNACDLFRARFQHSLRNCVRRRFSVAECFGVIWLETLEEISLSDLEQSQLYEELIGWAKHGPLLELDPSLQQPAAALENLIHLRLSRP